MYICDDISIFKRCNLCLIIYIFTSLFVVNVYFKHKSFDKTKTAIISQIFFFQVSTSQCSIGNLHTTYLGTYYIANIFPIFKTREAINFNT